MKKKFFSILMMLVVFCTLLTLNANAQDDGVVTNKNGETVQSVPQNEGKITGKEGKTGTHLQFRNVQTGLIEPDAVIVGTISCDDAGGYWMECGWHVTSSSKITRINLDVICSTGGEHGFFYGLNRPDYQTWNTLDEYCGGPGEYFAELSGQVTTIAGLYQLVPVKADNTTIH